MGEVKLSSTDSLGSDGVARHARPDFSQARARRRFRQGIRAVPTYFILSIFLLVAVIPFIIALIAAFKTNAEIAQGVFSLPEVWRWSNFADAWAQARFALYFRSSVIVTGGVVVGSTFLSMRH